MQRITGRSGSDTHLRCDLLRPPHLPPVPPKRAALVQATALERAGDAPARPAAAAQWSERPVNGAERAARREALGRPPAPLRPRAPRPGFRRDRGCPAAPRRRRKPAHAGAGGGRPLRPRRRRRCRSARRTDASTSPCPSWKATKSWRLRWPETAAPV